MKGQRGYAPRMAKHIEKPTIIQSAGNKPKRIEEFVGRVEHRDGRERASRA